MPLVRPLQGCHVQTGFPSLWKTVSYWSKPSGGPPRQSVVQSTGCTWETEEYGLAEKKRVRETILLSIILKWKSPEKVETRLFSEMCCDRMIDNRQNWPRAVFLTIRVGDTGTGTQRKFDISVHRIAQNWHVHGLSSILQLDLLWAGGRTGWPLEMPSKLNSSVTV